MDITSMKYTRDKVLLEAHHHPFELPWSNSFPLHDDDVPTLLPTFMGNSKGQRGRGHPQLLD